MRPLFKGLLFVTIFSVVILYSSIFYFNRFDGVIVEEERQWFDKTGEKLAVIDEGEYKPLRLAILLMVHSIDTAIGIERVMTRLYDPRHTFVIHVDGGADFRTLTLIRTIVRQFDPQGTNVFIIRTQHNLWGGISLIQTYLDMVNKALTSGREWDFAINFSGNCYPIKTLYQIETRLTSLKGRNFMDVDGLSGFQNLDKTGERWDRFWIEIERIPEVPTLRSTTLRVEEICPSCYKEQANSWGWVRNVPGDNKRIYPDSKGLTRDMVRQGSQWMTLSREFCEYLISDPLARDYLVAFGTTFVPDESFIPTMLYTTDWNRTLFHTDKATPEEKRQALMRHIVWTPGQWHPNTLKSQDLPKIFASNGLFARKFDPWASRVYEDIDFVIDSTVPEHSRYSGYNSTISIKKPDIDEENKNNNGEDNNGTGDNRHGDQENDVDVRDRKGQARYRRKVHFAGRSE
eukprot:TRINITY_DN13205_c0_g1_i1.p1 TRINITY_DN13205_c0_g1~~TRINITY_DN13205_c0_g1_i1.p1  ORF type:complete len:459 (-),score=82.77 TRINITY_DN13205_c0_g1_i1:83-1459(-)